MELEKVARKYSPIIYQGLGSDPSADEFTRVDFDGDWDPDNNWDNQPKYPRPAAVYWDVIEGERHFFITYAFFYPRDYANWCFWIHCHENDFEGMRVTVKKAQAFGQEKLIKIEGLAHNYQSQALNPKTVEVVIESAGHGVHPKALREIEKNHKRYSPKDYELIPLSELWNKRKTNLFTGAFTYAGKNYPANFGGNKWLLFGIGAAKPAWSWVVWNSDLEKGQWFLDPLKDSKEKYLFHSLFGIHPKSK